MKQLIIATAILAATAFVGCDGSSMLESQPAESFTMDKAIGPVPSSEGTFDFAQMIDFGSSDIGGAEESQVAEVAGTVDYSISGSSQDPYLAQVSLSVHASLRPKGCDVIADFVGQSSDQLTLPASGFPTLMVKFYHPTASGVPAQVEDYVLCIEYMVDRNSNSIVSVKNVWLGDKLPN